MPRLANNIGTVTLERFVAAMEQQHDRDDITDDVSTDELFAEWAIAQWLRLEIHRYRRAEAARAVVNEDLTD